MIYIKENTMDRIRNWSDDSICVLTDFDRTITTGNSPSSWSILSNSNMISNEYVKDSYELYNYYRPVELDESMDYETRCKLMIEWWDKHVDLFIKYGLSEEGINDSIRNFNFMSFREGIKEFLENMNDRNIPVIIISAGIGNVIKEFFIMNDCFYNNMFIVSNFLKFENGFVVGVSDKVIHSLNKSEVSLPDDIKELIKTRQNIILLGDSLSDVRMAMEEVRDNALKIGFLEENVVDNKTYFEKEFDVVCTDNCSYNKLSSKIKILRR